MDMQDAILGDMEIEAVVLWGVLERRWRLRKKYLGTFHPPWSFILGERITS